MRRSLQLVASKFVTLQLNLQFLNSAKGDRFEARARVTKAGKAQLFASADLTAWRDGAEVLAASASAGLAKVGRGERGWLSATRSQIALLLDPMAQIPVTTVPAPHPCNLGLHGPALAITILARVSRCLPGGGVWRRYETNAEDKVVEVAVSTRAIIAVEPPFTVLCNFLNVIPGRVAGSRASGRFRFDRQRTISRIGTVCVRGPNLRKLFAAQPMKIEHHKLMLTGALALQGHLECAASRQIRLPFRHEITPLRSMIRKHRRYK
jgi:hypothetical protein